MAKRHKPRRTDDKHIAGVERIAASPEDIARALFKSKPIDPSEHKRQGKGK